MGDQLNTDMNAFDSNGWAVLELPFVQNKISEAKELFNQQFLPKFTDDAQLNRELIKRFADHPFVASIFCSEEFVEAISKVAGISTAVKCGPLVSHYTSNNMTGNGYGLPYHQDYPSMGSSHRSVICWVNLADSGPEAHGVEVLSGRHKEGLLKGEQSGSAYVLDASVFEEAEATVPVISAGSVLLMSSFLPHRTYVNADFSGWKLSLSQRFDDLDDREWGVRGFKNAYRTAVDRDLYIGSI